MVLREHCQDSMLTNVTNHASSENDLTIAPGQGGRRLDISRLLPALARALLSGVVDLELALIDQLLDQRVLVMTAAGQIHSFQHDLLIEAAAIRSQSARG